jgi:hypothetical protein
MIAQRGAISVKTATTAAPTRPCPSHSPRVLTAFPMRSSREAGTGNLRFQVTVCKVQTAGHDGGGIVGGGLIRLGVPGSAPMDSGAEPGTTGWGCGTTPPPSGLRPEPGLRLRSGVRSGDSPTTSSSDLTRRSMPCGCRGTVRGLVPPGCDGRHPVHHQGVDGRDRPGHDGGGWCRVMPCSSRGSGFGLRPPRNDKDGCVRFGAPSVTATR